ncbi:MULTISPECIES: hypothetical protein [unclassified Frankia]
MMLSITYLLLHYVPIGLPEKPGSLFRARSRPVASGHAGRVL